jgi:hypothetical protein
MADVIDENTIQSTLIVPSKVFTDPIYYKLLPNNSPAVLLQPLTLQARFYADMIKDMGVPYPGGRGGLTPSEMRNIIGFAFNFDVGSSGLSPNAYKTTTLSARYKDAIDTQGITTYRNILKTSTLAIAGYSNAVYQVYESGLGVDKVCSRITGCKSVDTAAAHLDTAGKGSVEVTSYLNMNIDSDTFQSFGFPDGLSVETIWTTATTCKITFNNLNYGLPIDLVPNRGPALTPFTLGNAQKNKILSDLLSAHTNGLDYIGDTFTIPYDEILSTMKMILLVKEYGDVLQILEYLAIIKYLESLIRVDDPEKLQKSQKIRSMFNMQTTDSVVFELCVALGLSCTYTGSREEVTSGGITVVIYESAPVAPGTNEKNRIDSMYEGFKSQLNAVKFGVNTGIAVLSSLSYQIPDGWVAPGKRVVRSTSPRNTTGDRTVTDIANNFYSDTQILYESRMMNSAESTLLKMSALQILSGAIETTLVTLANTYNAIIGGTLAQIDINAAETALQTNAIINFTIGTTEINAPYNEPPLVKVKGQGWVIKNDGMRAKFAEYSGYVGPSMAPPHPVVQGGKKGVRKPVQSKKKPVHSKKKPVQYGGAGDSVELGLEECIYLKEAIRQTRYDDADADAKDMITLKYNEIVSQSISNPALYPTLLHQFGGYHDVDDAGNPAVDDAGNPVVSMDEETSDTILREMNDFAEQKLHIADTDHNKELKKLMGDYLAGIYTLTTDWTGRRASRRQTSNPIPPQVTSLTAPCGYDITMISYMNFNEQPCVHIEKLLTDTYNYLTFMLPKLDFNQTFVFVTLGDPDDPAGSWTLGKIVNDKGNGTFIVNNSNGVPGQFPASHIKLAKFHTLSTDLPIDTFVFVTPGDPNDPATSWTPGKIVNDNGNGTFIVNDSNGNSAQFHISHIKLLINSVIDEINSVIDDFKHFWVNIGTIEFPNWFKVTDQQIMIGLNELFSLWTEGKSFFIKGGNKKTKKKRNKRKHTKKMKFRKAPKSKKHRKTKRKGK